MSDSDSIERFPDTTSGEYKTPSGEKKEKKMGMLGGIKEAQATEGGNYIQPGLFVLSVDVLKGITSRKGDEMFVSEFGVIESTNEKQPPGSHVSWLANLRHDAALGNIKSCLMAITGLDEIDDDDAEEAIDEEKNPLHGKFVKCEATEITTKAGNPFTKCRWERVTEEQVKAFTKARKSLGIS